jgi:hypothetical protein
MTTPATSYRTPQPSLTLEARAEQTPLTNRRTLHRVCRDLEQLCEMGILEAFRDEYNVVRYRPVNGSAAL